YNQLFLASEKNTYIWQKNIYDITEQAVDWNVPSKQLYVANLVLEGLDKDKTGTTAIKSQLKGEALFFRAMAVYNMAIMYAGSYDAATANTVLGVPYRMASDVFVVSKRPSLQETYDQLVTDLTTAISLLAPKSDQLTRPSKEAAHTLLAKVFLEMGQYAQAAEQAIKALAINNALLDYQSINAAANPRFELFNQEYIFFTFSYYDFSFLYYSTINKDLYNLYENGDARKTLFFTVSGTGATQSVSFSGSYAPAPYNFAGLARDEVYLIAAESYARTNQSTLALQYLNSLLSKRYTTASFVPVNLSGDALVKKVLEERRKELVFRNRRWNDLKRMNREPALATTLTRTVAGKNYTLPPNDPRYVYPIPQTVIDATGIPQNER
ncbi:MAG: RagB/SusD family nutrient uptake outer membrane protein, partial [Bacteroidetes bacterium]|nr:RagB/SusD family nutrient uptake outer membrane protein [Bacteroidota bacterium]